MIILLIMLGVLIAPYVICYIYDRIYDYVDMIKYNRERSKKGRKNCGKI